MIIGLHINPRQHFEQRRWNLFARLADKLALNNIVVFTGSKEDGGYVSQVEERTRGHNIIISLTPNLQGFALLLNTFDVFVTVNTAAMHIAIARKIPTVAIIGGTPASVVCPKDNPLFEYVEDPGLKDYPDYTPRINEITVDRVIEKIEKLKYAKVA